MPTEARWKGGLKTGVARLLADRILGRGRHNWRRWGGVSSCPWLVARCTSGDITHQPSTADHNDNETEGDPVDGDKEGAIRECVQVHHLVISLAGGAVSTQPATFDWPALADHNPGGWQAEKPRRAAVHQEPSAESWRRGSVDAKSRCASSSRGEDSRAADRGVVQTQAAAVAVQQWRRAQG